MSSVLKKGGSSFTNSTRRILMTAFLRRSARSLASSITPATPVALSLAPGA
jgi:hypothetical protein